MLQHVSEILNRKEGATKQADADKDETRHLLCNVSERIPRAVHAFNVLFL
jgi:hypothetical protein